MKRSANAPGGLVHRVSLRRVCLVAAADALLYSKEKQEKDKRKNDFRPSTNVTKPAELPAADVQSQLDAAAGEEACFALLALLALDESVSQILQ